MKMKYRKQAKRCKKGILMQNLKVVRMELPNITTILTQRNHRQQLRVSCISWPSLAYEQHSAVPLSTPVREAEKVTNLKLVVDDQLRDKLRLVAG